MPRPDLTPEGAYSLAEALFRSNGQRDPRLEKVFAVAPGLVDAFRYDVLGEPKEVFATWQDISVGLKLNYEGPDEFWASDYSYGQAQSWLQEHVEDIDAVPTEVQDEVRYAIEAAVSDHWSLKNVLEKNLDLGGLVGAINEWSRAGEQMAIYNERTLPAGEGILDWSIEENGVRFIIARPFLIAYIEGAYCTMGFGDEGMEISDLGGHDVAHVMRWIKECEGGHTGLDLDRWEDRLAHPTYQELVQVYEKAMKDYRKARRKKAK